MRNWRWALAALAVVAAAGVFVTGRMNDADRGGTGDRAKVVDARGDVFGTADAAVAATLDLREASVERVDGAYRFAVVLDKPLDRAVLTAQPARYRFELVSRRLYRVTVRVSASTDDAFVTEGSVDERPYVLGRPRVSGAVVSVDVPDEAVAELRAPFTWGVEAHGAGSLDSAPSDRSARFPGGGERAARAELLEGRESNS